ncbi:U3 small nucleolar RNA-associated protein 13 [Nematocida major]|uniref:U3 small nucleolar RNA-associated protein 13 n=1 Tax=Nematocida major TaxID=1912982 RepID=UPI002008290A|nr:U3 small nucleolar RNA-associated protein 13 [Nematocida major]KAH9387174.1 U3 small nucleolar RNA-associated protein 13 [Nematocida major]
MNPEKTEGIRETARIEPIFNALGACMIGRTLYTGYNSALVGTHAESGRIEVVKEVESEIVRVFPVFGDVLISTVTGDVYIYSPNSGMLRSIMKNSIVRCADAQSGMILLGTAEGSVFLVNAETEDVILHKKVDGFVSAVKCVEMASAKRPYKVGSQILAVGDALGSVTLFNLHGDVIYRETSCHSGSVSFVGSVGNRILTAGGDGLLIEHAIGSDMLVRNLQAPIVAGSALGEALILASPDSLLFLDQEMKLTRRKALDTPAVNGIHVFGEECLLTTEESDLLICSLEEEFADRIFVGNNDEITDMLVKGNRLIVGTNSRFIRAMEISAIAKSPDTEASKCAFFGQMFASQNADCTLSLCDADETHFFSGTKDGYITKYEAPSSSTSPVRPILDAKTESPVTALCLHAGVLVSGHESGIVSGWRAEDLSLLFTASVGETEVTGICIFNGKIHCSSKAKEISALDFTGKVCSKLSGHRKGIWALSTHESAMLSGSVDGTARFWKSGASTILQHNASVVKTLLAERALTATSDGVLRIWNLATHKELAAMRMTELKNERIWAMRAFAEREYILSVGPSICLVRDSTWEIEREKEQKKKEEYLAKQRAISYTKGGMHVLAALEYYRLDMLREAGIALREVKQEDDISALVEAVSAEMEKFAKVAMRWVRSLSLFGVVQRVLRELLKREAAFPRKEGEEISKTLHRTSEILNGAY